MYEIQYEYNNIMLVWIIKYKETQLIILLKSQIKIIKNRFIFFFCYFITNRRLMNRIITLNKKYK